METITYALLIIALLLVCDNRYSRKFYVPLKTACSASFLVILALHTYNNGMGGILGIALLACFLGDVMMGLYNTYSIKKHIICGIVFFMVGHVAFLSYMMVISQSSTSYYVFVIPFVMCILLSIVYKLSHLHMGRIKYPVFIYCYFVSAMCVKAIELHINAIPEYMLSTGKIASAGILFFLSDFSILFLYFYHFKNKWHKREVHYFNLVTYYAAIYLFILSII